MAPKPGRRCLRLILKAEDESSAWRSTSRAACVGDGSMTGPGAWRLLLPHRCGREAAYVELQTFVEASC